MSDNSLKHLVELVNHILRHFADMSEIDIDQAIDNALESIGEFSGVDRSYMFDLSYDGKLINNTHEWCAQGINSEINNLKNIDFDSIGFWKKKLYAGEHVYIPFVDALPEGRRQEKEILLPQQIKSLIVVPLVGSDKLYGFIGFDSVKCPRNWDETEILLLKAVADIIVGGLIRYQTYTALSQKEKQFRLLIQHSSDLIIILNKDLRIIFIGDSINQLLGYDTDLLIGSFYLDIIHEDERLNIKNLLYSNNKTLELPDHRIKNSNHNWRWYTAHFNNLIDDPNIQGIIINAHDISLRKETEEKIKYQALHDHLTGLSNRNHLIERLKKALDFIKNQNKYIGLIFIDLDHFKNINDSLGHNIGDMLLKEVSLRLSQSVSEHDTVARFGGDEFVILIEHIKNEIEIISIAEKILELFELPFFIHDRDRLIGASAGVVIADGSVDHATLIRDADAAMYQAKSKGRARLQIFDASLQQKLTDKIELANDLRNSEKRNELVLYYQPIYNNENIISFEALIRWMHPKKGLINPIDFIEIAENTGLIIPIGNWVINQAITQISDFNRMGLNFNIAINLSSKQIQNLTIVDYIKDQIIEHNIKPDQLTIELTESTLMSELDTGIQILSSLKELGCQLAIDDFGTGYSSMSYLKDFPMDKIKIDKSFVKNLVKSEKDRRVIKAMINLAHDLNMLVVAEGVEDIIMLKILNKLGCDFYQGYYFSKPIPIKNVYKFINIDPLQLLLDA